MEEFDKFEEQFENFIGKNDKNKKEAINTEFESKMADF